MIYHCCDELRRNAVADDPTLNGIDFLEVVDAAAPAGSPRQRTLLVRLLKNVPAGLDQGHVRIEGGERVREVAVEWAGAASGPLPEATAAETAFFGALAEPEKVFVVRTDRAGDFSRYQLRLVRSTSADEPPDDFDAPLSIVGFSFKVECESDFDCRPTTYCPEEPRSEPTIDYLAKDYPSFRRLVLDRLTRLVPDWSERSAADMGVALAELIAYVADQLSYQQDAVATEAYLETCRLRTSLRRHALLVDYHVHDGCNARAWLHVAPRGATVNLARAGTRFYTRVGGQPARITPDSGEDRTALAAGPAVFEPLHDTVLRRAHNEIALYTWGEERCCLPAGSTRATLASHLPHLRAGDVLLLEEVMGPSTGRAGDADPRHRHVVRLTGVVAFSPDDESGQAHLVDPLTGEDVTEVEWGEADALPFPLCVSSVADKEHGGAVLPAVSVVRGNMVLADHGRTLAPEFLPAVSEPHLAYPSERDVDHCGETVEQPIPPHFRPYLAEGPLTVAATVRKVAMVDGKPRVEHVSFDPDGPASDAMRWRMEDTLPAVRLHLLASPLGEPWEPRRDLLNSDAGQPHFVVEVEHDGRARLRFGNDVHGARPRSGTVLVATYRVGNGRAGNVGADTIHHTVTTADVAGVRNPLPAHGGVDMEDAATVRRRAPQAFRRQERAVTPRDYADVTQQAAGVQRAAATMRWTGSWHTVFVTVDRVGGALLDDPFEAGLRRHVEPYRMAGHDTEFDNPVYVSLEIDLLVCVKRGYLRSAVRQGLLQELGNRTLPDGRRGVFHQDRLTFGDVVYLSPLYAAARRVPGVESVTVTRFHRQGQPDPRFLAQGFMRLSRLEVPRLDNDPNFPEHGVLRLSLVGGT